MAWGKRKQDNEKSSNATPAVTRLIGEAREVSSIIGPSLVITGEVQAEQDITVLGKIVGKVVSKATVYVGASGLIEGDVVCDTIKVDGCVRGNVKASRNITIETSGKLFGDINTKEFINRPGGLFEGFSRMTDGNKPKDGTSSKQTDKAKQQEKEGTAQP